MSPSTGASLELCARESHTGQRVDRVLAELLHEAGHAEISRGAVQRLLDEEAIHVEGAPIGAKHRVRAGQVFALTLAPPPPTHAVAEDGIAFEIVYVDDDLVVVDKPAGLVVHPARGHAGGTLVNGLLGRGLFARELLAEGSEEEHDRPGIVHRIDKDTSGLLVVARTVLAREGLKRQFAAHDLERSYEAIAVGAVASGTIATLHGRHPSDRVKFSSRVREGKRAVTHVEALHTFADCTHLRCRLETGRTHQIRVHLADQGTPLLGDTLYGKPVRVARLAQAAARLGRQALHARTLGFVHPRSGQALHFESPLPADFQAALALLGGDGDAGAP